MRSLATLILAAAPLLAAPVPKPVSAGGPGAVKRLKQWLRLGHTYGTFAHFDAVKRIDTTEELLAAVEAG